MASTAMINTTNNNQKSFLIHKKPLMMLKDYLLDDFSSCSSSGFKSFPRRQCCTTVRLLLEIDLNNKNSKPPQQPHLKRSTTSSYAAISALQKASKAVINAVKLLPFPSSSSSVKSSPVTSRSRNRKGVIRLPRSISRKLFKNRKADHHRERDSGKIREWKMFGEFLDEIDKPPQDQISPSSAVSASSACDGDGNSACSSTSNCNSWTESEFTGHSSCSESYRSQNGAGEEKVSGGAGEIVGGDSINYSAENTKEWGNEEEKEQFSPVSVLDCPFQDDDEEEDIISSPFQRSRLSMEGSKPKFMAKTRKFETLAGIEPMNLEHQIDQLSVDEQNKSSTSKHIQEQQQEAAEKLVKQVVSRTQHQNHRSDGLLLDFFKERALEKNGSLQFDEDIDVANKWINGEVEEMFLGWEVKDKRHVYVRDMERNNGWKWRNFDEDKEELVLELEFEIFTSLVDEALLE